VNSPHQGTVLVRQNTYTRHRVLSTRVFRAAGETATLDSGGLGHQGAGF
jgi:hypothetical protein